MTPTRKRAPKSPRVRLEVALAGDTRLVENVVLQVRELAQRLGLGVPQVRILRRSTSKAPKQKGRMPRNPRAERKHHS